MPNRPRRVSIEKDTAKYYLNLEAAFDRICRELKVDPQVYLEQFQSVTYSFDVTKRELFRSDLYESWTKATAKSEFVPRRNPPAVSTRIGEPRRKRGGPSVPPPF